MGLLDPEFWARLFGIGILNLLLSGDNAVVIALAVRMLPRRERVLGQVWGTLGAVLLRLAFLGVVTALLRAPLVRLAGGAALVWIAVKLVAPGEEAVGHGRHGTSVWEAIWIIVFADFTMSLDNVLAVAAAAHGQFVLIVVGIALSLPLVVWGAGALARFMNRHPWIVWLGGGLLGYVAGEMMFEDEVFRSRLTAPAGLRYGVPVGLALVIGVLGWRQAARAGRAGPSERA